MSEVKSVNIDAVSFVHGVSFASQLKQQKLTFFNPDELVSLFAEYRANGLGGFEAQSAVAGLREIAAKSENFTKLEGEDKAKAIDTFSKLFFMDIDKSPLGSELVIQKFEEGFVDFWKNDSMPPQEQLQEYSEFMAEIGAKEGIQFLAENAKRSEVHVTESGLQYEILENAEGPKPSAEQTVVAHYEGTLIDGTKFDSSYDRGEATEFPLNKVIKGWTEGLQLMSIGAKFKFYIPFELGYGAQGAGENIPPYAALIFIVELKEIK
jgi:FKBP-type peptidyl-prolyl cis-trans isomerase FklB